MGSPFVLQTLKEIVSPSVAQLSSVLPALVASLRTESQPWEAYVLYEQIMGVSKGWEDFFASSGLAGVGAAEDGEGALRKVLNGPLKGLCLRSLPEAVEGAKVGTSLRLRPQMGPVRTDLTRMHPPLFRRRLVPESSHCQPQCSVTPSTYDFLHPTRARLRL